MPDDLSFLKEVNKARVEDSGNSWFSRHFGSQGANAEPAPSPESQAIKKRKQQLLDEKGEE